MNETQDDLSGATKSVETADAAAARRRDALPAIARAFDYTSGWQGSEDTAEGGTSPDAPPTSVWRLELIRWLATLNPGRTQTEYQKAVGYFFETPGVPQFLEYLTFDLLLAYRGALALRATAHDRGAGKRSQGSPASGRSVITGEVLPELEPGAGPGAGRTQMEAPDTATTSRQSRLSPATVNLRITALRQFLVHCTLVGTLPQLTPDRIRAALRRMSVERRRPYQVLAEHEWADFLEAARMPVKFTSALHPDASGDATDGQPAENSLREAGLPGQTGEHKESGPWGIPRALRQTAVADRNSDATDALKDAATTLPHSRGGLTGRYTAHRDFALVSLALATGLRAIELAELDVGDMVREWQNGGEEWWLVLPDAKTKGQRGGRTLPLAPTLVETLLSYVTATGRRWDQESDQKTPLFLAGRRQCVSENRARVSRLSAQQIRAIVDRVETQWLALREVNTPPSNSIAAGETRKISPHALRHSTAIALLSGNDAAGRPPASVEHVRGWLGHFDIRTTQGYLAHLDARRHRRPYTLAFSETSTAAQSGEAPSDRK